MPLEQRKKLLGSSVSSPVKGPSREIQEGTPSLSKDRERFISGLAEILSSYEENADRAIKILGESPHGMHTKTGVSHAETADRSNTSREAAREVIQMVLNLLNLCWPE